MEMHSLTDARFALSQGETISRQAEKKKKKHKTVASASLSSVSVRVGAQRGCWLFQLMSQLAADRERERRREEKKQLVGTIRGSWPIGMQQGLLSC